MLISDFICKSATLSAIPAFCDVLPDKAEHMNGFVQACEEGSDMRRRRGKSEVRSNETLSIPLVVREVQRRSTLHRVEFVFSATDRHDDLF